MTKLGLDYSTTWGRGYAARFVRNAIHGLYVRPYIRFVASLEVRGLEHLDAPRPLIFVANHTSNLDTPLILSALPVALRRRTVVAAAMDNFFMNAKTAFKTVLVFNAIPIDRHKVNRRSAQLALELVEDHWNLIIYPEGGRTPDGQLQEFKGGAAYLAERAHATVIPTYLHEAGWLQGPKYAKAPKFVNAPRRWRHHVVVAFGPPLRAESDENIRRFGARIEDAVVHLGREVSGDPTLSINRPDEP
ncbi:MAG TPA: lysophospholipid acyltransferase family protein [Acidimicrobiales bacterium]|nr:lysophospholipid acyltransferase family protein [Acidimicrobiales bacterium]